MVDEAIHIGDAIRQIKTAPGMFDVDLILWAASSTFSALLQLCLQSGLSGDPASFIALRPPQGLNSKKLQTSLTIVCGVSAAMQTCLMVSAARNPGVSVLAEPSDLIELMEALRDPNTLPTPLERALLDLGDVEAGSEDEGVAKIENGSAAFGIQSQATFQIATEAVASKTLPSIELVTTPTDPRHMPGIGHAYDLRQSRRVDRFEPALDTVVELESDEGADSSDDEDEAKTPEDEVYVQDHALPTLPPASRCVNPAQSRDSIDDPLKSLEPEFGSDLVRVASRRDHVAAIV